MEADYLIALSRGKLTNKKYFTGSRSMAHSRTMKSKGWCWLPSRLGLIPDLLSSLGELDDLKVVQVEKTPKYRKL